MRESWRGDGEAEPKREGRLRREKRTIRCMVEMYCRGHHRSAGGALCGECRRLLEYALERVELCPYRTRKPACSACTVHCYRPELREEMRRVMRYAGPRMLVRHPLLALLHLTAVIRGRRPVARPK